MIFLTRCAWHPKYTGQTLWLRVERLPEGHGIQVSDGICKACRARAFQEFTEEQ